MSLKRFRVEAKQLPTQSPQSLKSKLFFNPAVLPFPAHREFEISKQYSQKISSILHNVARGFPRRTTNQIDGSFSTDKLIET